MSLPAFLRLFCLAPVCLAASPAAPVTPRTVAAPERLPTFDASGALPTSLEFERLATTDALAALKASITRSQRQVHGFHATFLKQERMGGKLHPPEEIAVKFREEPFAVLMQWRSGSRTAAEATLFVRGENNGSMLVRLKKFGVTTTAAFGTGDGLARGSARYGIEDFGILLGSQRTLKSWLAAAERNELDLEYLGLQTAPELNGRKCYAIRRTCRADTIDPFLLGEPPVMVTDKNRSDSFRSVTIYFDPDTWLQVGSEQKRADGERIGAYFFRDVVLNPAFTPDEFKAALFKK